MRALLYLTKRSMINNLKKAVKKPLTLLVVLACAAYAVFLAVMLAELAVQMKFDNAPPSKRQLCSIRRVDG